MRKKLLMGNWKMHGSFASIEKLVGELNQFAATTSLPHTLAVMPTFIHVPLVAQHLSKQIRFGTQDVSDVADEGAYTGQVSARMIKEMGCGYVLVGHSERRQFCHETDALIAKKIQAALAYQLTPVLCVGETLLEYEAGVTTMRIQQQIDAIIASLGVEAFSRVIIAYEPIWAIGSGLSATPETAQAVHQMIRGIFQALNPEIAQQLCILYGGSVNPGNARALFAMPDIDGGLVGGASLVAEKFLSIYQAI